MFKIEMPHQTSSLISEMNVSGACWPRQQTHMRLYGVVSAKTSPSSPITAPPNPVTLDLQLIHYLTTTSYCKVLDVGAMLKLHDAIRISTLLPKAPG